MYLASNIVVQIYQHHFGTMFYDKPLMSHAFPQLLCFDLLPSSSFLCALSSTPSATEGGLQISPQDYELFKVLKSQPKKISDAIKAFKKRGQTQPESDEEDFEE